MGGGGGGDGLDRVGGGGLGHGNKGGGGIGGGGERTKFSAAAPVRLEEASLARPTRETVHVERSIAWKIVAAHPFSTRTLMLAVPEASAVADCSPPLPPTITERVSHGAASS